MFTRYEPPPKHWPKALPPRSTSATTPVLKRSPKVPSHPIRYTRNGPALSAKQEAQIDAIFKELGL